MIRAVVGLLLTAACLGACVSALPQPTFEQGAGGATGGALAGTGGTSAPSTAGSMGGVSAPGGSGGATGPEVSYTFDTDRQSWELSTYVDSFYVNLGAATVPNSGVNLDGGTPPTLEWTGTDGIPSLGALKLTVTFTDFKQYVDSRVNLPTPIDLNHRVIRAQVRRVSGAFPAGGVQLHVSSGLTGPNAYVYVSAPLVPAADLNSGWTTVTLDTSVVQPTDGRAFDASQIVQIGVVFTTGDPNGGGLPPPDPTVFEIDLVQG